MIEKEEVARSSAAAMRREAKERERRVEEHIELIY